MQLNNVIQTFLYWSFIICFAHLFLLYAFTFFLIIVSTFETQRRKPEMHTDDYNALLYSRFTIPVSVIAPAYNEEGMVATIVRRLLSFDYPEFEVIIVNDGSRDRTLEILVREFDLEPI